MTDEAVMKKRKAFLDDTKCEGKSKKDDTNKKTNLKTAYFSAIGCFHHMKIH